MLRNTRNIKFSSNKRNCLTHTALERTGTIIAEGFRGHLSRLLACDSAPNTSFQCFYFSAQQSGCIAYLVRDPNM